MRSFAVASSGATAIAFSAASSAPGEIAVAAAIRRQDQERLRVVGLRAGRLLDHRVGLRLVAARVVEAGEHVDQIEVVLALLMPSFSIFTASS